MHSLAVVIFIATYTGVAIGGIPGLALDRTGIALLGAIAMLATGILTTDAAIRSIDVPTILLLYSLMVLSSQFRLGGFYTWITFKTSHFMERPGRFLFIIMAVSAALSSIFVNDIVCLAFTPILTVSLLRAGLNPVPFLIGLAVSSNIGSAATIMGNPQNMLIGQLGRLHFGRFLIWCAPPAILSLVGAYFIIKLRYLNRLTADHAHDAVPAEWPEFNRRQSSKGIIAMLFLLAAFFTPIPREISAIVIAGLLLCSRTIHTRSILGLVDWHLITLFCALFILIKGIENANIPSDLIGILNEHGIDLRNLYILAGTSALLSNIVSNVPATMLLANFLDPAVHSQWYVLALSSTFAGNLITIGSIANLITFELAKEQGVVIGFKEHAMTGFPVTAFSIATVYAWIGMAGYLFG
jgi:Na+/H+ antiporter NhaD/arsenite permease-like protein